MNERDRPDRLTRTALARRIVVTILGGTLSLVGIALLVLPGPGLLLVLAGLVLLASEYAWARRLTGPVRQHALRAAEESVSSRGRIAASALCGVALIVAGSVWALVPTLPFAGPATGSSLILSGVLVLALLAYSHRRVERNRRAGPVR